MDAIRVSLSSNDLLDDDLFGNEAGDDEDLKNLNNYFLEKSNYLDFYKDKKKLMFVKSRKGMGKSALLRQTINEKSKTEDNIVVYVKSTDLINLIKNEDNSFDTQVFTWQQRICTRINFELARLTNIALNDDSILLIESAELHNFKSKNIVSALIDRIKIKSDVISIDFEKSNIKNNQELLNRIIQLQNRRVWLLIDDIDANFRNIEEDRIKISSFLTACRNLVSSVNLINIRASIRSDVWSVLSQHDESLDKCEQYILNINWSTKETGQILRNKILTYVNNNLDLPFAMTSNDGKHKIDKNDNRPVEIIEDNDVRALVFKEPYQWGAKTLESFRPIHILSAGRPRWASQLCKLAAKNAIDKNYNIISINHVKSVLKDYGRFRLSDLYKEHRHQCPSIQFIIESFSNQKYKYTTEELINFITEKIILSIGAQKIDGVIADRPSLVIANFLYRCGFIFGRDDLVSNSLSFIKYEDRPDLLCSNANLDDGLTWEIHPSYRDVLRINETFKNN